MLTTDRHGLPEPQPMPPWIGQQIAALQALDRDQLGALWAQTYCRPAPPWLGRQLLLRALAHRLQEDALGGLAPAGQQRLKMRRSTIERIKDESKGAGAPR